MNHAMKGRPTSLRLPLVAAFLLAAGMAVSVMVEERGIPVPVPGFDPAAAGKVFASHAQEPKGVAAGVRQGLAPGMTAPARPAVVVSPVPSSVERAQEAALRVAESRQAPPEPYAPVAREDVLVYLSWKGDRFHSNPLCSNGNYVAVRRSEVPDRFTPCRRCCDE